MKKGIVVTFAVFCLVLSSGSKGHSTEVFFDSVAFMKQSLQTLEAVSEERAMNWLVGDYAHYNMSIGFISGTIERTVTGDEGEAIWLETITTLFGTTQEVLALIGKRDGKILRILVNGEEQPYEEPEIKIIDQRREEVTVPAGTFKATYSKVLEGDKNIEMESWVDPLKVPAGGEIKSIVNLKLVNLTTELTAYGHAE